VSGSGYVDMVFGANVPNTNRPARMVLVNRHDGPQVQFAIPVDGPAPVYGDAIEWGPHHAEFGGHKVDKLTWEMDPNSFEKPV
jgi:hypothetical protein